MEIGSRMKPNESAVAIEVRMKSSESAEIRNKNQRQE